METNFQNLLIYLSLLGFFEFDCVRFFYFHENIDAFVNDLKFDLLKEFRNIETGNKRVGK